MHMHMHMHEVPMDEVKIPIGWYMHMHGQICRYADTSICTRAYARTHRKSEAVISSVSRT